MVVLKQQGEEVKSFSGVASMAFWASSHQHDMPKPEWKLHQRVSGLLKDGVFDLDQIKDILINHFEYEWIE
jgi:hypothetical protein